MYTWIESVANSKILFSLESETPVDICMIQLYMHVMASANDDMLKSQVQVKCQCMQVFTPIYMGCGSGQIQSPRLNLSL